MIDILYKSESFAIIGACMEVHRILGNGFKEVLYKDALQMEFTQNSIPFEREKRFQVEYKGIILRHTYVADFVLYNSIILEAKSANKMNDQFLAQTINYLKASQMKLGIIANFGERSFTFKRVVF
jgi:GxxExxY protein